jgi:CheY-like chemotaxis protein
VPRVLIIDDSDLVRTALQQALAPYELEVEHAENGGVALQKLSSARWDLVFLDLELPVMDGPTVLRLARARGLTAPVILVTSVSSTTVVSNLLRLGATQYILKPFTAEQVRSAAVSVLRLDHKLLDLPPPQILVQYVDSALPEQLAPLFPAHVIFDRSGSLAQSLDLAEDGGYSLVLLESDQPREELVAVAGLLRRTLPAAGIFQLAGGATSHAPWSPSDALDGTLPRVLSATLAADLLYPSFVRPLVFVEGATVRAAGFQGNHAYLPAYFASVGRGLAARGAALEQGDITIDLCHVPPLDDAVVALIGELAASLSAVGIAPFFRVDQRLRATLEGRPALAGVLLG